MHLRWDVSSTLQQYKTVLIIKHYIAEFVSKSCSSVNLSGKQIQNNEKNQDQDSSLIIVNKIRNSKHTN